MGWFTQTLSDWSAWLSHHARVGWWLLGLSLALTLGGIVLVRWLVLRMPYDYFIRPRALGWQARHPLARLSLLVAKNLIGAVLLVLGLTMLVTPGPGIVTVLAALMLLDIPGKRAFEARIIAIPAVLHTINSLRERANRPPIELPDSCRTG